MATNSKYIEQLKKDIEIGEGKISNGERKTLMIKLPKDEYDNLTNFITLVNNNTKEKVTKQSIVYKILVESGLLDDINKDN
jgi:hypothetical protein